MPTSAIIAILVAIIIVVLTQYYNREFPLQYMENGEMKTEVFNSPKETFRDSTLFDCGAKSDLATLIISPQNQTSVGNVFIFISL